MRALKLVQAAIKRFYYEHHDKLVMEAELAKEVKDSRVRAFTETKRRVVDALDYRIDSLKKGHEVIKRESYNDSFKWEARIDELETLRQHFKGMTIKVEEDEPTQG